MKMSILFYSRHPERSEGPHTRSLRYALSRKVTQLAARGPSPSSRFGMTKF